MSGQKPAQLITTPLDPPFPSSQAFQIEGKLSEDGTFEAKVEDTMLGGTRGPPCASLSAKYRNRSGRSWCSRFSYALGFAGIVSEVTASAPELIVEPFTSPTPTIAKTIPTGATHQFTVPGLPFFMPTLKDDAADPIGLGLHK